MKTRIFLSYSHKDEKVANMIRDALLCVNISVVAYPFSDISLGKSISTSIREALAATDLIIILISPDWLKSQLMKHEMETFMSLEWQQRAITVIPVKVRPCVVPQYLLQWNAFDITRSLSWGIERLVSMVRLAPSINLLSLSGTEFEHLVRKLLQAYGFRKIRHADVWQDRGFDFSAEYQTKDPFGRKSTEQWVIEVKDTRNRTDISAIKEFIGSFSFRNERYMALFVTATQLTSAAKEWIASLQKQNVPRLIILEGTDIVRMLLRKPKVIEKFFPSESI